MSKTNILFPCILLLLLNDLHAQKIDLQLKKLSDAPTDSVIHQPTIFDTISYKEALHHWKTILDVNNWIKENFQYSFERAKQLSENSTTRSKTKIYSPIELYQKKKGVCIDLSRFAVETINILDSTIQIQYLMIEFEPISINGSIIRKHWMTTYKDASGNNFLADSKRPGYIARNYKNIEDFIKDYQIFRKRKIVSWKVLPSYKKKRKRLIKRKIDNDN